MLTDNSLFPQLHDVLLIGCFAYVYIEQVALTPVQNGVAIFPSWLPCLVYSTSVLLQQDTTSLFHKKDTRETTRRVGKVSHLRSGANQSHSGFAHSRKPPDSVGSATADTRANRVPDSMDKRLAER